MDGWSQIVDWAQGLDKWDQYANSYNQTNIIDLTINEPWVKHVVERPRSPADNKLTHDLVYTFRDKTFDVFGTGDCKTRIPYKDREGNLDLQF